MFFCADLTGRSYSVHCIPRPIDLGYYVAPFQGFQTAAWPPQQPQSQLWAALQVLKEPHKPPNNLNLNYERPCKP